MRALRVGDGGASLVDIVAPAARGEALVRVTMSGICNTDLELARGYAGFRGTIGHEFVGVVEDAGGGPLARGERVVGEINAGCGACALLRDAATRGTARPVPCSASSAATARTPTSLRLPARNLVRVPDGVRDEHAVFVEPLAAACGVLERCPLWPGARRRRHRRRQARSALRDGARRQRCIAAADRQARRQARDRPRAKHRDRDARRCAQARPRIRCRGRGVRWSERLRARARLAAPTRHRSSSSRRFMARRPSTPPASSSRRSKSSARAAAGSRQRSTYSLEVRSMSRRSSAM